MNAPVNTQVNELQVLEQNVIVAAFAKRGGTDELYERIAQEVRSHVPDVSTKKGRDAIGSLALKISKSKTLIEKCGKELVAEQKAQIKLIDDDRIAIVKKFDQLRDEILAPRDAWEQAEKDRVAKHSQFISNIKVMYGLCFDLPSLEIKKAIDSLESLVVDSSLDEYEQEAKLAKFETIEALRTALVAREKYEAEQAELERLRKAEILRQQQEREAQIAREAAEKATREAEEKARFEAERVQREKAEAEQREARLVAEKEAAELRSQHAAEAERKRIEAEQAAKLEAERQADEARQANQAHRKKICNEALKGLLALGIDEAKSKEILQAINKGLVPHVSIKF
ncbi:hypothetical protein BFR78_009030 [Acinetobacter pittii]|uniref:hypothetical protein n=1 Tax=Acinetobacter pittii TaxID=48296 RepID=UPI0008388E9D|nr:hypothetical protein [Acinetobacter pittii]MCK0877501.1 hypothetical protein [Acinetobacter pittii]